MRSRAMRRATARYLWDRMKVSLWFVPLVMALAAFCLSGLLGRLDEHVPNVILNNSNFFIAGSATEMRAIMIGVAGTILATTGVVFSLLTLPLSTVASQFGSRLLRVFMRDRTTQFVLGTFVGTFCYCLATALSIPNRPQTAAPQISVTFGLILTLATFASLIALIQHISIMLQAPNIVASAGAELMNVIRSESSDEAGESQSRSVPERSGTGSLVESEAYPLRLTKTGYIQFVDPQIVLNLAQENDLIIHLLRKPGQFVWSGVTAALVWPKAKVDERLIKHLQRAIQVGNQRTPVQDVEYAINQLVEVAVRAMSPAINDPFTALTCLDYLIDGLVSYVRSGEINPNIYDDDGKLRLIFEPASAAQLHCSAFDMLRHASCDNASVLLHMLNTLRVIGREAKSPELRQELLRHVSLIQAESQVSDLVEQDRQAIRLRCESLQAGLG